LTADSSLGGMQTMHGTGSFYMRMGSSGVISDSLPLD